MLAGYTDVLRRPGAFATSAAAMIGRIPISMLGLASVLLVTGRGGSYALAGSVSATFVLSGAFLGPALARFIDRHGQRRVVPWLSAVHLAALMLFLLLVETHQPPLLFALAAGVAGGAQPPFGVLIRSRWSYVLSGDPRLGTAYALESLLDEVIFIGGPPLATFLAVSVWAPAPMFLAVVLVTLGTALMLAQRRTEPPVSAAEIASDGPVVFARGMPVLVIVFLLLGALFGGFEVAAVAFGQEHGSRGYAGPLLGLWSFGSLIGGLVFGARPTRRPLPSLFLISLGVLMVASAPFALAPNVPVMAVFFLIGGLAVSPSLIVGFRLVESSAPEGRMNEALSWAGTGLGAGIALAATLTGAVIDAHGASPAFLVGSAATALAFLTALSGRRETRASYRVTGDTGGGALPRPREGQD